jgi:hypothetical protein
MTSRQRQCVLVEAATAAPPATVAKPVDVNRPRHAAFDHLCECVARLGGLRRVRDSTSVGEASTDKGVTPQFLLALPALTTQAFRQEETSR